MDGVDRAVVVLVRGASLSVLLEYMTIRRSLSAENSLTVNVGVKINLSSHHNTCRHRIFS
jgi:hypothetical protein